MIGCCRSWQFRAALIGLVGALGVSVPVGGQDTVVVRSDIPGLWGEEIRLVEEVRIGVLEGAEEYMFGRIWRVAAGLDGSIFVLDGQLPVIRMYDANGDFLRNVGGKGEGPGEYRTVLGMEVTKNGDLTIWDIGNKRISLYNGRGEYSDSYRVPSGLFSSSNVFHVDTAGNSM